MAYRLNMEDGLYGAIIAGVVAVLVAILSAYLGAMWGRRHERERWARDVKLGLYSDYLKLASSHSDQNPQMQKERNVSLSHLSLAAPEAITAQAEEVHHLLRTLARLPKDIDTPEHAEVIREYYTKFNSLVYEMRLDLQRLPFKQRKQYRLYIKKTYDSRPLRVQPPLYQDT